MILELQRFLLVAKEGNITRTAEKIFITQSALTQSIQRLEKEIGAKLFDQHGKQLALTDEGKSLVIIATRIMQLWKNAKNPVLRKFHIQTYSIGMFDNAALRLGSYLQRNILANNYQLELTIDGSPKLLSQLKLGVLDTAICVLSKKITIPKNISLIQTFTEELIPVSANKFSSNIQDIPFILYNKDSFTREQTDLVFSKKNIQPKIFAESTSTTFMKELALLGSGVALLPKNAIRSELAQKTLIKQHLPLQWKRSYGVYINTQRDLHKDHPIIKEILKALEKNS